MFESLRNFITKLQNSPEAVRKRWLFMLSGIAMILILGLWIIYMNLMVAASPPSVALDESKPNNPSTLETFKAGLAALLAQIKESGGDLIAYLKKKASTPNLISIEGREIDFIVNDLEPIPETPLP